MSKLKERLLKEEQLNESTSMDRRSVADAFTRYILGDKKSSLSMLNKLSSSNIGVKVDSDSGEYNRQYERVYKGLLNIIEKEV